MHSLGMTTDLDAASLRDALALLGDWESDFASLFETAPLPTDEPPRQPTTRPTKYRLRRNARRTTLAELQLQAETLQHVLLHEHAQRNAQRVASTTMAALAREAQDMAQRQKRQRIAAETENAALRECAVTQRAIARRVATLLRKAALLERLLGPVGDHSVSSRYNGPTASLPQQLRHLDVQLDQAGVVLTSGIFATHRGADFQRVSFRDLGLHGLQVEFAASWVVPFGVDAVERALWSQVTNTDHRGMQSEHQLTHHESDLLSSRFVSTPHALGDKPSCNHGQPIPGAATHGEAVFRRCNTAGSDGMRFVLTRIRGRILDDYGKPKGDMYGDGWYQIEPLLRAQGTAITPQISRIKMCRRATSVPVDHETALPAARAKWVHSVVTSHMLQHWETNLALSMQAIENALLLPKRIA